jgi:hypothetical protein
LASSQWSNQSITKGEDAMTDTDPLTRSDMMLIRKAFKQGWNVPADERQRAVARLRQVLNDPARSARDKQKASETLASIEGTI